MIEISEAAPIRGDMKLLTSGSGTLAAENPVARYYVGSFDLPALDGSEKILIHYEVQKVDGGSTGNIFGMVAYTKSITPANTPAYISTTTAHFCVFSEVIRSLVDTDKINYYNIRTATPVTVMVAKSNVWNTINAPRTIYICLDTIADTDLEYSFAVYLVGSNVK